MLQLLLDAAYADEPGAFFDLQKTFTEIPVFDETCWIR
jgi:hypothetical protein